MSIFFHITLNTSNSNPISIVLSNFCRGKGTTVRLYYSLSMSYNSIYTREYIYYSFKICKYNNTFLNNQSIFEFLQADMFFLEITLHHLYGILEAF